MEASLFSLVGFLGEGSEEADAMRHPRQSSETKFKTATLEPMSFREETKQRRCERTPFDGQHQFRKAVVLGCIYNCLRQAPIKATGSCSNKIY